MAVPNRLVNY